MTNAEIKARRRFAREGGIARTKKLGKKGLRAHAYKMLAAKKLKAGRAITN